MTQKVLFKQAALLFSMAALVASCAQSDTESDATHTGKGVTLIAKASTSTEPETRMGYQDNITSMSFTWADNGVTKESFSALVQDGGTTPVTFTQTSAGGTKDGSFSGKFGATPSTGQALYAIYPALRATPPSQTAIPLDLSRQTLAATADGLNHNKLHYMWAKTTYAGSSEVDFQFAHKIAIVKVEMTLPADAGAIKQVNFIGLHAKAHLDATSGAVDFTGVTEQESVIENVTNIALTDHKLTAYIFVFGQDASKEILKLTATDAAGKLYWVEFTGRDIVVGKVYTLKKTLDVVPSGIQSWEGSTIDVPSKEIKQGFAAFDLKVGDYYYSDGTWSDGGYRKYADGTTATLPVMPVLTDANNKSRTVIGIVYWVGDATARDKTLKKDHPGCTHGLVVALSGEERVVWQDPSISVQDWLNINKSGEFLPVQSGTEMDDPLDNIQGYNNTKAIEAFNTANSSNLVTAVQKAVDYRSTVPAPGSSSDWYLPSGKELSLLCGTDVYHIWKNNSGIANRDLINGKLKLMGGVTQLSSSHYWSSSESSGSGAFGVFFGNGDVSGFYKYSILMVRLSLAF